MKFVPTAICVGVAMAAVARTVSAGQSMRLADCPILPDTVIEDCNVINYVLRVAGVLVPGLLLALGTFIAMFIYCCARCCCGCCGGGKQVQSYTNCNCCGTGCCCAGGNVPARYSYFEIARVRLTALSLIALGAIILVYGVVAAGETQSGIASLLDAVADPVAGIVEFVNELDADLTVTLYNDTTDETYTRAFLPSDIRTQVDDVANSISGSVGNVVDAARGPIKGVIAGIFAAVIVPAGILVLIAAMGVFNVRKCGPMLAAALLFVLVFIVWVLHSIVGVLALLVGDVAAEVQGVVSLEQNVITALVPCPTDAVNTLRETFDDFTTEQLGNACNELSQRCYWSNQSYVDNADQGRTFDCSGPSLDCSNPTSAYLYQLATETLKVAAPIAGNLMAVSQGITCDTHTTNCTLQLCASECRVQSSGELSSVGKMSKAAIVTLEAAIHVEDVIERNAGQLYVCEVLMARVVRPFAKPLTDVANGAYNLRTATGLEGVFCTFAIFVCAWGAKRFLDLEQAGRLQYDQVLPDVPKP